MNPSVFLTASGTEKWSRSHLRDQQNRLLNLRMLDEINADTFAAKSQEFRDCEAELKLEIDVADRDRHEIMDIAVKAFELSQSLRQRWVTADYDAKRRILEIVCLNCSLVDASLVVTMRKPFDLLAKGLVSKDSRGDKTAIELFRTNSLVDPRALHFMCQAFTAQAG